MVKFLVEKGFVGGSEKWDNIVLVGTKNDKADDDDRECFREQVVPELFAFATNKTGAYALVEKSDYSDLLGCISRLPGASARSSRDAVEMQPRWSRGAAEMTSRSSTPLPDAPGDASEVRPWPRPPRASPGTDALEKAKKAVSTCTSSRASTSHRPPPRR